MKSAFTALALLSAGLLLAAEADKKAGDAPSPNELSLPRNESYVDEATGLVFPCELAGFVKTQVVKNTNPYYGTVVRYAATDGSCADVYIYSLGQPLDEALLQTHFQGVMKVISHLPGTGPVRTLNVKSEGDVKLGSEHLTDVKVARFTFTASNGGVFDSELALFAFKDKVMKIRVSSPASAKIDPLAFETDIVRLCEMAALKKPAGKN